MNRNFMFVKNGVNIALYAGVLDEAHEKGLMSITVKLLQIPDEENNFVAICEASITMKDGRSFSDIGDASPANVSKPMQSATIRMAATRAKARALRDAINYGEAVFEEFSDDGPLPSLRGNNNQSPPTTNNNPTTPRSNLYKGDKIALTKISDNVKPKLQLEAKKLGSFEVGFATATTGEDVAVVATEVGLYQLDEVSRARILAFMKAAPGYKEYLESVRVKSEAAKTQTQAQGGDTA